MTLTKRVDALEKKMGTILYLLIYIAGAISVKFGGELIPGVLALIR